MAEPADINVDELRRRARRRLVGAVVLALGVAVIVPMLLETEQKPLGEDVSVKIPPVDSGKFVNRLNDGAAKTDASPKVDEPPKDATATPPASSDAAPVRAQKYDTQIPDSAPQTPAADATPATPSVAAETKAEPAPAAPVQATKSAAVESSKAGAVASHPSNETPKPTHTANAPMPRDGFAVQLAAFTHDREANSLAGRLKKAGYAAYTEPLKTSKGTMWRVRVGPYPSRDAAVAARDKLKAEGEIGIVAAIK
ncbi:MAG TPA: SPOR domain-containing protein [Casimicrobiaceae bacterium]